MDGLLILGDILISSSPEPEIPVGPARINVADLITDVIIIIGGISAAYFGVKKWVKQQAKASQTIAEDIQTTNGRTIGQITEDNVIMLKDVGLKADRNYELFQQLSRRMDEHMQFGGHHTHDNH